MPRAVFLPKLSHVFCLSTSRCAHEITNMMKWEWFEIREIKDIKKLRILFILFSPILLYCIATAYFTLLMLIGGPIAEIFNIESELLIKIQFTIAIILAIPSIIGIWRSYKNRKLKNLDASSPFMI